MEKLQVGQTARQGFSVGRAHICTLMQGMGSNVIYRKPRAKPSKSNGLILFGNNGTDQIAVENFFAYVGSTFNYAIEQFGFEDKK